MLEISGGSETILIVDDDPSVRRVARRILERYGYTVLEAGRDTEAIRLLEIHPGKIALVLMDVALPGLPGRLLAGALKSQRPETRVLYVTGYSAKAVGTERLVEPTAPIVYKPFKPEYLAWRVRDVLDRDPPPIQ